MDVSCIFVHPDIDSVPLFVGMQEGSIPMRGGGALDKVLYRAAPPQGPYPFIYHFLIEKVPLSYAFHTKLYPFHLPTKRLLPNFSLDKPLRNTWMNQPLGVSI